jgi:hypothetical protein
MSAPSQPLFRSLQDAIILSEARLMKREKEAAKGWDAKHGAKAELLAEEATLQALKTAYAVEKARAIADIPTAPSSEKQHPTPEMVWKWVEEDKCQAPGCPAPKPFPALEDLEILTKAQMMEYNWLAAIEEAIAYKGPKGSGKAHCSINNCLSHTYTEIKENGGLVCPGYPDDVVVRFKDGSLEIWSLTTEGSVINPLGVRDIHVTYDESETSHCTGWFFVDCYHGQAHKMSCESFYNR